MHPADTRNTQYKAHHTGHTNPQHTHVIHSHIAQCIYHTRDILTQKTHISHTTRMQQTTPQTRNTLSCETYVHTVYDMHTAVIGDTRNPHMQHGNTYYTFSTLGTCAQLHTTYVRIPIQHTQQSHIKHTSTVQHTHNTYNGAHNIHSHAEGTHMQYTQYLKSQINTTPYIQQT